MTTAIDETTWIWVIVASPDADAQYFGQQDDETGLAFIPAFYQKEHAQQGLERIAATTPAGCEVQAVRFGELARDAAANGFMVFMLDPGGRIVDKIRP